MIKENEKVRIKATGIVGEVIDIDSTGEELVYIIESDKKGTPGGYGAENSWKLFWCKPEEIEIIEREE